MHDLVSDINKWHFAISSKYAYTLHVNIIRPFFSIIFIINLGDSVVFNTYPMAHTVCCLLHVNHLSLFSHLPSAHSTVWTNVLVLISMFTQEPGYCEDFVVKRVILILIADSLFQGPVLWPLIERTALLWYIMYKRWQSGLAAASVSTFHVDLNISPVSLIGALIWRYWMGGWGSVN